MRLRLAILATVLLVCAPAALHAASLSWNRLDASIAFAFSPSSSTQPRIIVIGDKLVEDGTKQNLGWVSQLKGAYGDSVELYSLGSNLANTEAADSALASLLATPKGRAAFSRVMLVVLAFGSNEVHAAHSNVQQPWVSPRAFEQHLGSMVQQLQAHDDLKLLLVQPPPLQSLQEAAPYAEAVAEVAKQYQVPYVDTLAAISKTPAWKTEAFRNGDQMSQLGHDILFGRIGTEIKRQLPTVSPQGMSQRAQASSAAAAAVARAATQSRADAAAPTDADAATAAASSRARQRGGRAHPATSAVHSMRRSRGPAAAGISTAAAGGPLPASDKQADPTAAARAAAAAAPTLTLNDVIRGLPQRSRSDRPHSVRPVEYHDPDAGLPHVNDVLHSRLSKARAHSEPATTTSSSSNSSSSGSKPAGGWDNLDFVSKAINDELDNVPLNPPSAAKPVVTGATSSSKASILAAEPMQQKVTGTTAAAADSWKNNVPEPSNKPPAWFASVPEPTAKETKLMVIPEPHLTTLPKPSDPSQVAAVQSINLEAEAVPVPAAAPTWASTVPEPSESAPTWMAVVPEPTKSATTAAAAPAAVGAGSEQKQTEQPAAAAAAAPAAWYTNVPEPSNAAPAWQARVAEPSPAKYAALMQAHGMEQPKEPAAASKRLEPAAASAADTWGKQVPEPVATVPTWFSAVPEPKKGGSDSAQKPAAEAPAPAAADVPKQSAGGKPAAVAPADKPAAEQPAAKEAPKPAAEKPDAADVPKPAEKPEAVDVPKAAEQKPAAAGKPAVEAPNAAEQKPAAAGEVQKPAADKPAQQQPADKPAVAAAPKVDADKPVPEQKPASKEAPKAAADRPAEQRLAEQKQADKPAAKDAPKPAADTPDKSKQQKQAEQKPVAVVAPPKAAEQKPAEKPAAPVDAAKPSEQKPAAAADKVPAEKPAANKPAATVDSPKAAEHKPAEKPADKPAGKSKSADSADKLQDQSGEETFEVNLPPALKKWQTKVDYQRPAVKAPEQRLSYKPRKVGPNAPIAKPKRSAANYFAKLKPNWWRTAFEDDKEDQAVQDVHDSTALTFTHTPGGIDKLNPNPQAMMYPVNAQPTDSKTLDSLASRTPNLPSAEPTAVFTGPAAEADLEAKPTLLVPATTTPVVDVVPVAKTDSPSASPGTFRNSNSAVRAVPKTPITTPQQLPLAQQPAEGTFSGTQLPTQQQPAAQGAKPADKPVPAVNTAPVADVPVGADGAQPIIPGALKQAPAAPKDAAAVPSTPTFGATAPVADAAKDAAGTADKPQEPAPTPQGTFSPTTQQPASPALAPAPADDKPQGAGAADKAAPGTFGAQSGTFAPVPAAAAEPKHVGQAAGKKDTSGVVKPKGGQHPDDADVLLQNNDVQGEVQKSKDTPKDPKESNSNDETHDEYEEYPKEHHKEHTAEDKYGHDDPELHNTHDKHAKKAPHREPHKEPHRDKPNKEKPNKKEKPQKKHHHLKHPSKGHKHGPEEIHYTEEHKPEPYGQPDALYRPDGPEYPHDGYHPEHPTFYREEHEDPYHHRQHNEPYPAHFSADDRPLPLADAVRERDLMPEEELRGKDIDRAVSAEEDPSKPLIVTLGDYVMRQGSFGTGIVTSSADAPGWISRLAAAYGDKAQVVNRGQATATSPEGVEMVRTLLLDYPDAGERIKLVILSFGGNDAIQRSGDKVTKVDLAAYRGNIMTMVAELRKAGVNNIMLVTPPPAARRSDRRFKTVKDYAKASSEAAKSMNVPTVDLFSAVSSLKNWQASAMHEDGLRLSERGQQLLFKRVMKVLNSGQLQHVSPTKLQPQAVSQ